MLLSTSRQAVAVALVGVIAIAESAAIRFQVLHFDRSDATMSAPSMVTRRIQDLLADGRWRFVGLPPLDVGMPNGGQMYGLRDLRAYAALALRRHAEFLSLAGDKASDPWQRPEWHYPVTLHIPTLALSSVKYVALHRQYLDRVGPPRGLSELQVLGDVVLFENTWALPRFRIAHNVVPARSMAEALATLRKLVAESPTVSPPVWNSTVVVEGIGAVDTPAQDARLSGRDDEEWIRRVSEPNGQTITLEANLVRPGFAVVSDSFYPGWRATVNGLATPVHPANVQFRAVALPAGHHRVVLKYQSTWLELGSWLSGVGLALAALLMLPIRFKRRALD